MRTLVLKGHRANWHRCRPASPDPNDAICCSMQRHRKLIFISFNAFPKLGTQVASADLVQDLLQ
jgi:hypothetical protein